VRLLNDRIEAQWAEARRLTPPPGTLGVGSADFDLTLKATIGEAYLRGLRNTGDPEQALAVAREAGREAVAAWNAKGVQGRVPISSATEMKRWENAGDHLAEEIHRRFLQESGVATEGVPDLDLREPLPEESVPDSREESSP
jgi:hypothetical protein